MNKTKQITEPFAVRLNPQIKVELEKLIGEYKEQGTKGDFIELLIETFKANELSAGISNTEADLNELNTLTTRIYSLYSNLIDKSNININNLKSTAYEKMESKDDLIVELQKAIKELKERNHIQARQLSESNQSNDKFLMQIEELTNRVSLDNNLIDRITEDVKGIEELKRRNKTDTEKIRELESSLYFMTNINKELQETIASKESKLAAKDMEHKREIDMAEHDLESKYIKDLWKIKEDHQKEIRDLQDRNFKDKEETLDKYSERLDKVEHEKQDLKEYIEELKGRLNSEK